jgi:hypothetical protein
MSKIKMLELSFLIVNLRKGDGAISCAVTHRGGFRFVAVGHL